MIYFDNFDCYSKSSKCPFIESSLLKFLIFTLNWTETSEWLEVIYNTPPKKTQCITCFCFILFYFFNRNIKYSWVRRL